MLHEVEIDIFVAHSVAYEPHLPPPLAEPEPVDSRLEVIVPLVLMVMVAVSVVVFPLVVCVNHVQLTVFADAGLY